MEAQVLESLTRLMGRTAEAAPVPLLLAYPQKGLFREGLKGMTGGVACFAIVFFLQPTPWIGVPAAIVGSLFLAYLGQQILRYYLSLRLDDSGLIHEVVGYRKIIRWPELKRLRLHFYPHTKGAGQGMLVLTLWSGKHRIKLDSTLDHFPTLLGRAAQAARKQEMEFHPTTEENLKKIGL